MHAPSLRPALFAAVLAAAAIGCGDDASMTPSDEDGSGTNGGGSGEGGSTDGGGGSTDGGSGGGGGAADADFASLDPARFSILETVEDFSLVDCTLADGTATTCHRVVVQNVPAEWGPGCPATVDDVGGVGFYDPDGTARLYALDRALWDQMEADGFDIVDADGTVHVTVPTGPPGGGGGPGGGGPGGGGPPDMGGGDGTSSCLDAELVEELAITWLIPAEPRLADAPTAIELPTMEYSGLSLDGLPFAPPPPATVMGTTAALPALDPCGGHPQPDGPFHWHLTPHEANHVLDAAGIRDDVRCTAIQQSSSTIIGYAADGFAILGAQEPDGTEATGLDGCRGHDLGDGYHYHVSSTAAPNNLTCLSGVPANGFVGYQ